MISWRILTSNLCVHLNPNFRKSGLQTNILRSNYLPSSAGLKLYMNHTECGMYCMHNDFSLLVNNKIIYLYHFHIRGQPCNRYIHTDWTRKYSFTIFFLNTALTTIFLFLSLSLSNFIQKYKVYHKFFWKEFQVKNESFAIKNGCIF